MACGICNKDSVTLRLSSLLMPKYLALTLLFFKLLIDKKKMFVKGGFANPASSLFMDFRKVDLSPKTTGELFYFFLSIF